MSIRNNYYIGLLIPNHKENTLRMMDNFDIDILGDDDYDDDEIAFYVPRDTYIIEPRIDGFVKSVVENFVNDIVCRKMQRNLCW